MTEPMEKPHRPSHLPAAGLRLASLGLLILFLIRSDIASERVLEALILCATRVIPALLPFLIVSSLAVGAGLTDPVAKWLQKPCSALFGVGGDSGCTWLLGVLCGFPIATRCGLSLYETGRIGQKELMRLMTFSNLPSLAFTIGYVGHSLLKSATLGWLLWGATLLASMTVGALEQAWFGSVIQPDIPLRKRLRRPGLSTLLTDSIAGSCGSMMAICGFVVFFSALSGSIESLLPTFVPEGARALLWGSFELTGGMARAAACKSPLRYVLCGAFSGWSGLSVCFQLMSICAGKGLSFRPYVAAKLAQGILTPLFFMAMLWGFGFI